MKAYLSHLLWTIYVSPLWYIWVAMAVLVVFWGLCGLLGTKKLPKIWRGINIFCFICSVAAVLYVTVYDRSTKERFLQLIPFHFIIEAQEHIEILRSMLMNVFLFVPFGLSLPFVINKKAGRTIKISIITALIFSVGIEIIQFSFGFGRAETDDVLSNVFGTFIGTLSYSAVSFFYSKKANK